MESEYELDFNEVSSNDSMFQKKFTYKKDKDMAIIQSLSEIRNKLTDFSRNDKMSQSLTPDLMTFKSTQNIKKMPDLRYISSEEKFNNAGSAMSFMRQPTKQ